VSTTLLQLSNNVKVPERVKSPPQSGDPSQEPEKDDKVILDLE
jgi:hypothetical protein